MNLTSELYCRLADVVKWVEFLIVWTLQRQLAKKVRIDELLRLAQGLAAQQSNGAAVRLWGANLLRLAVAVSSEGRVSTEFRQAFVKRTPYVVVFG